MDRTLLHRLLAVALGVATGGGLWWFGANPGIAGAAGVSVLVLGLVMGRVVRQHPEFTASSGSWQDSKWTAVGQFFVIVVAFQAVFSAAVPLPDQIGLHVVVLATYMVGYFVGGLDALEGGSSDDERRSVDAVEPADD
ncbi:hypothetical protein C475_02809 [Halosimplex carlsbadense 2-9-1]|uniref:Uncharacterized protein n=1 Tax=Halosimplex carlsbadense 2-9-1 TaxID=797114 RepID=M0D1P1_9EURY|nr:hypothetical protein [Halosimplex carlsbadense]ELZ29431.1 hypothetical protein C475_02809 [Halosimplex carlsbadense 2-9-1]